MAAPDQEISLGPCVFCGEQIAPREIDPCSITVETQAGKWQVWYCHADCFKQRIAKIDFDLSPAHF